MFTVEQSTIDLSTPSRNNGFWWKWQRRQLLPVRFRIRILLSYSRWCFYEYFFRSRNKFIHTPKLTWNFFSKAVNYMNKANYVDQVRIENVEGFSSFHHIWCRITSKNADFLSDRFIVIIKYGVTIIYEPSYS